MRIRNKKNLTPRLEKVSDIMYIPKITQPDHRKLIGSEIIKESLADKVFIEIGCGMGSFTTLLAKQNPSVQIIAIEQEKNAIVKAAEIAKENNCKNILFMAVDAGYLLRFIKPNSVDRIYLNFSCPYPKKSYANRRLTNPKFLKIYSEILKKDGLIFQKTDNDSFFEYSNESFSELGFINKICCRDLYKSPYLSDNIPTEYEKKFVKQNKSINFAVWQNSGGEK
ncbi:MAG: tRNA (guanosine(46)-N7)-methyltransferase TrmB [Clostridia bacterium]|nr:tRNA (guanosine(46)-N7)-methyltransferase TrmB [Clostridia bacterium]